MREKPWLYRGEVLHTRLRPARNAFRYPVFFLRFPLSQMAGLKNSVFSINRFNLLSFHTRDHGDRCEDGAALIAWIQALLNRHGIKDADGEIELQAFPRVLGYVFNPVSFWYCHNKAGALVCVLAEVNNTFGERHCYLLSGAHGKIGNGELLEADKNFHVSPFCDVKGGYRFRFMRAQDRMVARIDYHDEGGDLIHTSVSGTAQEAHAAGFLKALLAQPLLTLGVMARIHWQAARLAFKRVPFFSKPAPPAHFVSR
jgi:uncharacterized protein